MKSGVSQDHSDFLIPTSCCKLLPLATQVLSLVLEVRLWFKLRETCLQHQGPDCGSGSAPLLSYSRTSG